MLILINKRFISCLVIGGILFLNGCSLTGTKKATKNKKSSITAKQELKKDNLTVELDSLESNAEDIIDDIVKANWKSADTKIKKIKTNMNIIEKYYKSVHIPKDLITNLDNATISLSKEVTAKNKLESQIKANLVTKYIPNIIDLDKQPMPTDVMRLDYLGREISLNSQKKNYISAANNLNTTKFIWINVKDKMSSTYNKDIININTMLSNLEKSIVQKNSDAIIKNSNIFLEGVDKLETDFTYQSK